MINILKRCFLLMVLLWCFTFVPEVRAQIVMTPSAGCAPLSVQFSGPAGATAVQWSLAGSMTNLLNPSQLFSAAGNYVISYSAVLNGNPVTYTAQLKISSPPQGSFSFTMPPTRCKPVAVNFAGGGGSAGSTYKYAFGDLSALGTGSAVSHSYLTAGSFSPVMIIFDAVSGCTAVANNQSGVVHVSDPANIVISADPGFSACDAQLITSVSGSTSISGSPKGGGLSNWKWTFNAGVPNSGSGVSPGTINFPMGVHTISVSATDNNSCTTSASSLVAVVNPSLSMPQTVTVCLGESVVVGFQSTEAFVQVEGPGLSPTVVPKYIKITPVLPGSNIFTVTATPPFPCATITKTFEIFAEQLLVDFTVTPQKSCGPLVVGNYSANVTINTSSPLSYTWTGLSKGYNIISPSTVAGSSATFTFYQAQSGNQYTIYKLYEPTLKVLVASTFCEMEVEKETQIKIQRPTAWIYTDQNEGCSPLSVTVRDSSKSFLPDYAITGYTIFSGQGTNSLTSPHATLFPVTFTYSSPGTYSAYLIIETQGGCVDTSFMHPIRVTNPPQVSMTFTPNLSVCAGVPVQINMTSTGTAVQHWHVTTDQGYFSGCVSDQSPAFPFSHTGTHTLSLHAYSHGCEGTAVPAQTITVKGPYGKARIRGSCMAGLRKTVEARIHLQEANNAVLDFGDSSPPVNITGNPVGSSSHVFSHTYASSGDYVLTLVSHNNSSTCAPHTFTTLVKVRDAEAQISYKNVVLAGSDTFALGCMGDTLRLRSDFSKDVMTGCERGYLWMLSTSNYVFPTHDTIAPVYKNDTLEHKKIYRMVLRVKDENECIEYDTIHFRVSSAVPSFSFAKNPVCFSDGAIQVFNQSQNLQHPDDQITVSSWLFGDGSPPLVPANPLDHPFHTYSSAASPYQLFNVLLTVTNNLGCSDTLYKSIQINNPLVNMQASQWFPCIMKNGTTAVTITASPGYVSYSVNVGSSPPQSFTTTQNTFPAYYGVPGEKQITVRVLDNAGCSNSETRTITVVGQPTAQIFFPDDANKFCVPATPTIISNSLEYITPITDTIWSVGNISTPSPGTGTLNIVFQSVGIHTVGLTVSVNGLCPSTTTAVIVAADPKATMHLSKSRVCLGDTIQVSLLDTNSVEGWRWFFGDFVSQPDLYAGSPLALFNPTLSYPYQILPQDPLGKTVVSLRYFGALGTCPRTSTANLQVIKVEADFTHDRNEYSHCLGTEDAFTGTSVNPYGLDFTYKWKFGDDTEGAGVTASHTYTAPGQYSVVLTARSPELGCADTSVREMVIYPLPQASLTIGSDAVCPGTTVTLQGSGRPGVSGNVTGTLIPATGFVFDSLNTFSLPVAAAATTTYVLLVEDNNHCVSPPDTAVLRILSPPVAIRWDTTIIVGQSVQLNSYMGNNYTYTWSPVTDYLTCDDCFNPVSTSTANITYSVMVTDHPLQCYVSTNVFTIFVNPLLTLDVPTAFTPDGDGTNDIIYPGGWGISKLLYFRIYNRWGQLLYETDELEKGWDGRYNGEPQNTETYVYQVAVEGLNGEVQTKSGSFKLLR